MRYFFWGAIVLVAAVTSVVACRIGNVGPGSISVIDTIELTCDIEINEGDEISIYKLTVSGYLGTRDEHIEKVLPVVSQSFDLFVSGTIESIENIVLYVYINGDTKAVKYNAAYAVLEKLM